jgi:hypothetical protein
MLSRRSFLRASLMVAVVPPLGVVLPSSAAQPTKRLVIVTQKSNALAELSLRDLKHMFLSEQVDGPGGPLIPLQQAPGSATRQAFESLVLKMSPDEVGRFWIDRKIRGQKGAPKAVAPVELLRRVIVSLPNTVTYLNATDLTDDLKVLKVEGQGPQDPGYPLQFD